MYDLIIKNGKIIDGTGSPSYYSDLAIKDGKIARIAKNITCGKNMIDARGGNLPPAYNNFTNYDVSICKRQEIIPHDLLFAFAVI